MSLSNLWFDLWGVSYHITKQSDPYWEHLGQGKWSEHGTNNGFAELPVQPTWTSPKQSC